MEKRRTAYSISIMILVAIIMVNSVQFLAQELVDVSPVVYDTSDKSVGFNATTEYGELQLDEIQVGPSFRHVFELEIRGVESKYESNTYYRITIKFEQITPAIVVERQEQTIEGYTIHRFHLSKYFDSSKNIKVNLELLSGDGNHTVNIIYSSQSLAIPYVDDPEVMMIKSKPIPSSFDHGRAYIWNTLGPTYLFFPTNLDFERYEIISMEVEIRLISYTEGDRVRLTVGHDEESVRVNDLVTMELDTELFETLIINLSVLSSSDIEFEITAISINLMEDDGTLNLPISSPVLSVIFVVAMYGFGLWIIRVYTEAEI